MNKKKKLKKNINKFKKNMKKEKEKKLILSNY